MMDVAGSKEGTSPGGTIGQQLFGRDLANKLIPRPFVGKGSRDLSESFQSQEMTRRMFLEGKCNLLLTTSVADEGLDFPACNAVVLMDGADNDISLVQRRGRVRKEGGETVVFLRPDTEDKYEQLEMCSKHAENALKLLSDERRHAKASCSRQNGALLGSALATSLPPLTHLCTLSLPSASMSAQKLPESAAAAAAAVSVAEEEEEEEEEDC